MNQMRSKAAFLAQRTYGRANTDKIIEMTENTACGLIVNILQMPDCVGGI